MSLTEEVQHLKIPLEHIRLATNNFGAENFIAKGGFGKVYIGKLVTASGQQTSVAVKRLDRTLGQGDREFLMEIQMLSCYWHKNLISLVGFCDESGEKILVYEHAKHGSLDKYLGDTGLSWIRRLQISVGAAHGFSHLHNGVGPHHRVIHRDIKSSNILLDENWEAKISDFGLSKIGPSNVGLSFLVTNVCGTFGYMDPQYMRTGVLTKESDVYSFGVVLFEILCGRLARTDQYQDERRFLPSIAQEYCEENRLEDIIPPNLRNQMNDRSLKMFSTAAYECLKESRRERPAMGWILEKLKKALELQSCSKASGFIPVGTWGSREIGGSENQWSFELEQDHKLRKITIDHGNHVIYSLTFTAEYRGSFKTSNKAGGWAGGQTVDEVTFDGDEEMVGINGTIGSRDGYTIISSISFETTKGTRGPFGTATAAEFSVPWDKGSLVGFYGLAGYYIDSIGMYVKASEEMMRVGTWGRTDPGGPENIWSFQIEKNHHLKTITIDHGDLVYSLTFTTLYKGSSNTSAKAGGWNGGEKVEEVGFDWNEELNGINGTVALSRGNGPGCTVISSIAFVTNKGIRGPYGAVRGRPFTLQWGEGSFGGFYGLCGWYIDSIGVYMSSAM